MNQSSSLNPLTKPFFALAKRFIGTGLTSRFPFLFSAFFWLWPKLVGNQTKVFTLTLPTSNDPSPTTNNQFTGSSLSEGGQPTTIKLKAYLKDANTGIYLLTKGSYEPVTSALFLSLIKPGDTVLDIGANLGYYSLLASTKAKQVIAFEPDESILPLLQENLALNQTQNVQIETLAVSDHAGQAFLQTDATHLGHGQLANSGQPVTLITLKEYLAEPQLKPSLIKMDIEGAEHDALKGMGKVKDCHLIIELNRHTAKEWGYTIKELLEQIRACGFTPQTLIDETRSQTLPFKKENLKKVLSHVHFCNLHCIS